MAHSDEEQEERTIVRLVVNDYKGKSGMIFARSGEKVHSYHPRHTDVVGSEVNEEETLLFPDTGGVLHLDGGSLGDTLDVLERFLDRPLDYVTIKDKDISKYEPILRMSKAVGESTGIYSSA